MRTAQDAFLEKFGRANAVEIAEMAEQRSFNPEGKTEGRPDFAGYIPSLNCWKFIEVKRKKTGDSIGDRQAKWLRFFNDRFGKEAAIELELRQRIG